MKKFILVFSLLLFVSITVAFTFSDDSKKNNSACPYSKKMESSGCPYLNNKMLENHSKEKNNCPYSSGNSETLKDLRNKEIKTLKNIRT